MGKIPKAGGSSVKLGTGLHKARGLAVDATHVYVLDGDKALLKISKSGGSASTLCRPVFAPYEMVCSAVMAVLITGHASDETTIVAWNSVERCFRSRLR